MRDAYWSKNTRATSSRRLLTPHSSNTHPQVPGHVALPSRRSRRHHERHHLRWPACSIVTTTLWTSPSAGAQRREVQDQALRGPDPDAGRRQDVAVAGGVPLGGRDDPAEQRLWEVCDRLAARRQVEV